jgi:GNAT superfamily N-acetyltransferase
MHSEAYAETVAGHMPYFQPMPFRYRLTRAVRQPGFELLIARTGIETVGFVFGCSLSVDSGWWKEVSEGLLVNAAAQITDCVAFLQEIVVRTQWRRQGVGRLLHDGFLAARAERHAALCVLPDNAPARAAYAGWGWRTAGVTPPVPGQPQFHVMIKAL